MNVFNIGDPVIATAPVGRRRVTGVTGKVVGFDDCEGSDYIAVEFDEDIEGTEIDDIDYDDEDYECPEGHGWFVLPGDIAPVAPLDDFAVPTEPSLF